MGDGFFNEVAAHNLRAIRDKVEREHYRVIADCFAQPDTQQVRVRLMTNDYFEIDRDGLWTFHSGQDSTRHLHGMSVGTTPITVKVTSPTEKNAARRKSAIYAKTPDPVAGF
jgi:hypothetical protein